MSQQQKENKAIVDKPKLWELCRDGEAKKVEMVLRKASPSLLSRRWGPGSKSLKMAVFGCKKLGLQTPESKNGHHFLVDGG